MFFIYPSFGCTKKWMMAAHLKGKMMKKYSEDNKCPKCGNALVETRYCVYGYEEKLRRICGRCGYAWSELPLDYENEGEKGKE